MTTNTPLAVKQAEASLLNMFDSFKMHDFRWTKRFFLAVASLADAKKPARALNQSRPLGGIKASESPRSVED